MVGPGDSKVDYSFEVLLQRISTLQHIIRGLIKHRLGAQLGRDKTDMLCAGLVRVMRRNCPGNFVHMDELDVMVSSKGLFSANIYVQTCPSGGELEVFPITIPSSWEYYKHLSTLTLLLTPDEYSQQVAREKLPTPLVITPQVGDLVLLCAQRPHGVKGPLLGGDRYSIQTFLQHEKGKPLRVES